VFSTSITDQDNKEQMINPQEIKVRFMVWCYRVGSVGL
jgi:hypothetical protein